MGGTWFLPRAFFVFYSHLQRYSSPLELFWQSVRNIIAIRSQRNGKPQAAVGADLSCPRIRKYPRNGERKCVFDEMNVYIQ